MTLMQSLCYSQLLERALYEPRVAQLHRTVQNPGVVSLCKWITLPAAC